jgi:hypothetical protein
MMSLLKTTEQNIHIDIEVEHIMIFGPFLTPSVTGSATRKPRLAGVDKGRNKKQTVSLPGRPALWADCFKIPR